MKTYELELSWVLRVMPVLLLTVASVVMPAIVLRTAPAEGLIAAVPLLAILGWNWWVLLTMVYRVVLHDDGLIEWVALARRVRTAPEHVQRIGPDRTGSIGMFPVTHSAGRLRFINQLTGFHEVLLHIKSRNPSVEI